jgi:hypothetical protein
MDDGVGVRGGNGVEGVMDVGMVEAGEDDEGCDVYDIPSNACFYGSLHGFEAEDVSAHF